MSDDQSGKPDEWFDGENYVYEVEIIRRTKWRTVGAGSEVEVSGTESFSATVDAQTARAFNGLLAQAQGAVHHRDAPLSPDELRHLATYVGSGKGSDRLLRRLFEEARAADTTWYSTHEERPDA